MNAIIIIGGIILIILLIIGMIVTSSREQTLVEDRLNQYLGEQESTKAERDAQRSAITDWVSRRVERTSLGGRVAQSLARADLKFKVGEYFALIFLSVFIVGGIAWLLGGRNIISFLIGAVIGYPKSDRSHVVL